MLHFKVLTVLGNKEYFIIFAMKIICIVEQDLMIPLINQRKKVLIIYIFMIPEGLIN